jgi:hypothetical protein
VASPAGRCAILLVPAALLLAACTYHGTGPARLLKPDGETVTIQSEQGLETTGELVCVERERLVLLRERRYAAVPLQGVRSLKVQGYPLVALPEERERLVLYARYPRGLAPEQWRVLLQLRGQQEIDPFPTPAPAGPGGPGPGSKP